MARIHEITIFDGTPEEIERIQHGPQVPQGEMIAHNIAIQRLIKENEEMKKSLEILLGGKNDKKRDK